MKKLSFVLVAMALVVAACGSDDSSSTTVPEPTTTSPTPDTQAPPVIDGITVALSDAARTKPLALTDGSVTDVAAADVDLGLALLRLAGEGGDNVFLSSYRGASALGMLSAGAVGDTQAEIAGVLGTDDLSAYHQGRNAIDAALAEVGFIPEGDAEPFTLRGVNTLFGQAGFAIEQDYLDVLARFYGLGVQLVDFVGAPDPSRVLINTWVEEQTEERIEDLIPEGVITVDTRVVLVNAVYFKANWLDQFDPAATTVASFTTADGTVDTDFMNGSVRTDYAFGDGYEAIRLSYIGNTTSMVIIVPDDLASFVANADAGTIAAVRNSMSDHQVELSMPRFEFTTELGLKPLLKQLGIQQAFVPPAGSEGADLTGIHAERILYVEDALHKAFVSVDEVGTEAAAATAIVISLESAPPPAVMTVDQPFLFIIENNTTGEPIFMGQVTDPSAG